MSRKGYRIITILAMLFFCGIGIIEGIIYRDIISLILCCGLGIFSFFMSGMQIISIYIEGENAVFLRVNGKKISSRIEDVLSIKNRYGTSEVIVEGAGTLYIIDLWTGVEVNNNGHIHYGIKRFDFPYSEFINFNS